MLGACTLFLMRVCMCVSGVGCGCRCVNARIREIFRKYRFTRSFPTTVARVSRVFEHQERRWMNIVLPPPVTFRAIYLGTRFGKLTYRFSTSFLSSIISRNLAVKLIVRTSWQVFPNCPPLMPPMYVLYVCDTIWKTSRSFEFILLRGECHS